jgi:hypothetical protein
LTLAANSILLPSEMDSKKSPAHQTTTHEAFDQSLIEYTLSLSPEERLVKHQKALNLVEELRQAGRSFYERSQQITKSPAGKSD